MKFEVSFNDAAVVFVNPKNNKAEKIALVDRMGTGDAIKAISSEQRAAVSASAGAVSLLATILDNPRFDGFKGQTPIMENVPKELKEAVRDMETETLKPVFVEIHTAKGAKPGTVEKLWQAFAKELRAGGSYAVAKGKVCAYFAHTGNLPTYVTSKGEQKCLTVAAIDKLLANARDGVEKPAVTVADRIVAIAKDVQERSDKEGSKPLDIGNPATAILALRDLLATYEGLQREAQEAALATYEASTVGDVSKAAAAVAVKASGKGKRRTPARMAQDGMTDAEIVKAMDADAALV